MAFGDDTGIFGLFGDDAPAAEGAGSPGTGRQLTVNGTAYPVHEDFASFAADAAAGKIALLRTTFDVPLRTHMERLMPVLTEAYGIDARQTRAITEGGFHCLACFADHSRAPLTHTPVTPTRRAGASGGHPMESGIGRTVPGEAGGLRTIPDIRG